MNSRIQLFLDIFKFLKTLSLETTDINPKIVNQSRLNYKFGLLSTSERQKVLDFFTSVIDQPAYNTEDHKRLRKMLIDWYTSNRTFITYAKGSNDPYNLESEALNELILSFGFPYPHKILTDLKKGAFLQALVQLYQKKGTPEVLVKTLQTYFSFSDIVLSEWWIVASPDIHNPGEYVFEAKSIPVYPRNLSNRQELVSVIPYSVFIDNDPLWQLTETELRDSYAINDITLPSITPHISLHSAINFTQMEPVYAILTRKFYESYQFFQFITRLNRDLSLTKYEGNYSILELSLAIIYVFSSGYTNEGVKFPFYTDEGQFTPLDQPDPITGVRDDIDDVNYSDIIKEYTEISKRPLTKDERETNLAKRYSIFTDDFVETNQVIQILKNSGDTLDELNHSFKQLLDEQIAAGVPKATILENLLFDYEGHLAITLELTDFPIMYGILGVGLKNKMMDIINFFKPFRVRLREFLTTFEFNDPLGDSQLEKDILILGIGQKIEDVYPRLIDEIGNLLIKQKLQDFYRACLDGAPRDEFLDGVLQKLEDTFPSEDSFSIPTIGGVLTDEFSTTNDVCHVSDIKIAKDYYRDDFDRLIKDEFIVEVINL
jgi:hypothetical protein